MNARHRYIVLNAGLWLLLALAGAAGIVLLRQYGAAVAERERARSVIARAEDHYEDGDFASCQAEIIQAMTRSPELLGELVDRFGGRLLGLPGVLEQLASNAERPHGAATASALPVAQLELMRGDAARAAQVLEQYVTAGGRDPRAALWQGRIALDAGDFPKARAEFARYWQANAAAKRAFAAAIKGGGDADQRVQDGRTLFRAGLWDEAFAAFTEARQAGATDPELGFFQGAAADLAGKTEEARAHYAKTLERLPNHLLSLRRLKALGAGAS